MFVLSNIAVIVICRCSNDIIYVYLEELDSGTYCNICVFRRVRQWYLL